MSLFSGRRDEEGRPLVTKDGFPLSPAASQKLRNHSPDGFEWGYGGSGPAQLALALCLDVLGEDQAHVWYQAFKDAHVAKFPHQEWHCTSEGIKAWWLARNVFKPVE